MALLTVNPACVHASHKYLLAAAHVIFQYRLLDIAADTLGIPRQEEMPVIRRVHMPQPCVDRMANVGVLSCRGDLIVLTDCILAVGLAERLAPRHRSIFPPVPRS